MVTTQRVRGLYGAELEPVLDTAARATWLEVPEGEEAKTLELAGRLWSQLLVSGGKRDSRLLAFGGGSAGDLGGFVAGCFLRGIEVVQLPTTLLAQVDAAIGGKTAIDLPEGKNMVGLFHHPAQVVADARWLASLPREQLRAGLAEVVKMAALLDAALLARVEADLDALLAGQPAALGPVVAAAAAAKVRVVEEDPLESGLRKVLNFGHTLGHALETVLGYQGLLHGDAVAYGMLFALRLAEARGLAAELAPRLRQLLGRFGLPSLPPGLDPETLIAALGRDKKAREDGLTWVLPAPLEDHRLFSKVAPEEVRAHLDSFLRDPLAPEMT